MEERALQWYLGQRILTVLTDKIIVPLTILTMPFRGIEKIVNDSQARSNVHQENERLKTRISQLVDAEMRANALAMKIKRFESLLSADVSLDIPVQKIAGRIVSETDGPFARSALLNVGLQNGVLFHLEMKASCPVACPWA